MLWLDNTRKPEACVGYKGEMATHPAKLPRALVLALAQTSFRTKSLFLWEIPARSDV